MTYRVALLLPAVLALGGALILHQPASAGAESPKITASAHLYDTYCAQCHGVQRNGKGVNTIGLSVQPRDHSDTVGVAPARSDDPRHQGGRRCGEQVRPDACVVVGSD